MELAKLGIPLSGYLHAPPVEQKPEWKESSAGLDGLGK
jgi:hypothetical protein